MTCRVSSSFEPAGKPRQQQSLRTILYVCEAGGIQWGVGCLCRTHTRIETHSGPDADQGVRNPSSTLPSFRCCVALGHPSPSLSLHILIYKRLRQLM